jgi:aspartyl-tRNA(Asn)/glutamyl-tRNA(Gln) amidotransferase subunit A
MTDLPFLSAVDLAAAIRRRAVSPVEVVEAVLERIARLDPQINAFCTLAADEARQAARAAEAALVRGDPIGPLHGVPVSIKDLILTRGIRTTRGSRLYADNVPTEDAPLVERLRAAGAIILGKTNTPEFGWKGVTDNLLFGPTRNPWNLDLTPGGSSGGAGAAAAAGFGPLHIGTDGGGSIRIPAAFCGVVGLKPSFGRIPTYPPSPASTLSHAGPLARTVADCALALTVLAGPDERDRFSLPASGEDYLGALQGDLRGLRVAWSRDLGYAVVEPEVAAVAELAARRFGDLGCLVEEAHPGFPDPTPHWFVLFDAGIATMLHDRPPGWEDLIDPGLRERVIQARQLSAFAVMRAEFVRHQVWDRLRQFFARYDLLLTPAVAVLPFPVGLNNPPTIAGRPAGHLNWSPFTMPFNLTGQPAIVVPCGWSRSGLPIGLQIVGRRFADAMVLRAAACFERLQPWADRRPPLD